MTARARITATDLAQAAALAKAQGVTVTIAANGKTVTIAPPLDAKGDSDQDDRKPQPWT